MNLYHVWQDSNKNYDTYSDFVCAAESEEDARNMNPRGGDADPWDSLVWVDSPDKVKVAMIGLAIPGVARGVICASFHAG